MIRKFVKTEVFQEEMRDYSITEDDIRLLEEELLKNPLKGDLIRNSGGARKIRFGM